MIKKQLKKNKKIIIFFLTILAAFINAFSVKTFINELNLVPLGVPGLSIIMQKILKFFEIKVEYYYIFFIINSSLLLWCYFKISKTIAKRSFLYVLIFTIVSHSLPYIHISSDKFINIMSGAVSNAVSSIILIYVGSSVGGFNIVGLYFSRKYNKGLIGVVNNITNTIIIVSFIFIATLETGIASLIIAIISSIIVDRYHNQSNYLMLMIVTNNPKPIMEYSTEKLNRTGTLFNSIGSYTRNNNKTYMLTISKVNYKSVLKDIRKLDKSAHITILKVYGIEGNMRSIIGESAI